MIASSSSITSAPPTTGIDIFRAAERELAAVLPPGWFVHGQLGLNNSAGTDATLSIQAPKKIDRTFRVTLKATPKRRDLGGLLAPSAHTPDKSSVDAMLIARFLPSQIREDLRRQKISFVDATGNIFIHSVDPVILISQDGAASDPWRGPGRPTGSLKGLPAARLVRALADFRPPYSSPTLARLSGASAGATYRLLEFLVDEMLVEKDGPLIHSVDWPNLIRRWSQDTGMAIPAGSGYIEPRGLSELRRKLRSTSRDEYVLTGSLAAEPYSVYAEARLATIYSNSPHLLAERLGWRSTDVGANVIIVSPRSPVVFDRTSEHDDLHIVAPSQAAADLLNGSGRQPAEGDALLQWMGAHEHEWRK